MLFGDKMNYFYKILILFIIIRKKKEKTIGKKCKFEQEMLKHIHDLKNELREKGWTQRDLPPEVHQPSFLRGDESDAQLGFKFE